MEALGPLRALLVGVLLSSAACRAIEGPNDDQGPARAHASALQIDNGPLDTAITLPEFAKVAQTVGPSVVGGISTVEVGGGGRMRGIGSGMVLSVQGEILTNEHVVRDAGGVKVQLADDTQV